MCKVMLTAGVKPAYNDNLIKFVKKMGELMTRGNDDGLGYAAVDTDGNLFAERWLNNKDAFKFYGHAKGDLFLSKMLGDSVKSSDKLETVYTKHGTPDLSKAVAVTLHTRFATSSRGMANTHPFIDQDTSLIHNGVISNVTDFNFKLSTCDSEAILISYLKHKANRFPEKVKEVADDLVGYYVAALFSRDSNNNRVLDLFKGHNDNLVACFVNELDTWVMATSYHDISSACKDLEFTCGSPFNLLDGHLLRFNPVTGELITRKEFSLGNRYSLSPNATGGYIYDSNTGTSRPIRSFPTKNSLSDEEIDYLKLPSSIRKMNQYEYWEHMYAGD